MASGRARTLVAECLRKVGIEEVLSALSELVASGAAARVSDVGSPVDSPSSESLADIARRFHRDSLSRSEVIGHHVEDTSWNMMLLAYADAVQDVPTSISAACGASGSPRTSALRHITRLEQDGLIRRRSDPTDGRRSFIAPTSLAMKRMEEMVQRFCVAPPPVPPSGGRK